MKRCCKCKNTISKTLFSKNKTRKDGFQDTCKACKAEYWRIKYPRKNPRTRKDPDRGKLLEQEREKRKRLVRSNKLKTDEFFAIKQRTRKLISHVIYKRGYTKKSKATDILGCSFEFFKAHIENQFLEGMNWENRDKWQIDHKIPVASARTEQELIQLNHYTNLQPLWTIDNSKKGCKIL